MKYFDAARKCLIYIKEAATPDYWDRHWDLDNLRHNITRKKFDRLVVPATKNFLPNGGRVLEGGCGTGVHVYSLKQEGFESVGIDIAPETVKAIKQAVPDLNVQLGDVFNLNFPDNHFDGYWSIGVIEHFWDGYNKILKEMYRVLKPDGYLFLTFPYMSPLRNLKAKGGEYTEYQSKNEPTGFYQFALNHNNVITQFEAAGFVIKKVKPFDGFNGLKNESALAAKLLNPIAKSNNKFFKILKVILSEILAPLFGHSVLLVLQKK